MCPKLTNALASRSGGALQDRSAAAPCSAPLDSLRKPSGLSRLCLRTNDGRGAMETAHNEWKILASPCSACEWEPATRGFRFVSSTLKAAVAQQILLLDNSSESGATR